LQIQGRRHHEHTVLGHSVLGRELQFYCGLGLDFIFLHWEEADTRVGAWGRRVGNASVGLGDKRAASVEDLDFEGLGLAHHEWILNRAHFDSGRQVSAGEAHALVHDFDRAQTHVELRVQVGKATENSPAVEITQSSKLLLGEIFLRQCDENDASGLHDDRHLEPDVEVCKFLHGRVVG
jgi:hypothetical protein